MESISLHLEQTPLIKYAKYFGDNSNPLPEDTRTTKVENGIIWNRHPNGGGWVAHTAKVNPRCFVGMNAWICIW